jgi:hypothetical protein
MFKNKLNSTVISIFVFPAQNLTKLQFVLDSQLYCTASKHILL